MLCVFQVEEQPEYEEPPLLPPRSADLIEEEEEEKQTYAECEPALYLRRKIMRILTHMLLQV